MYGRRRCRCHRIRNTRTHKHTVERVWSDACVIAYGWHCVVHLCMCTLWSRALPISRHSHSYARFFSFRCCCCWKKTRANESLSTCIICTNWTYMSCRRTTHFMCFTTTLCTIWIAGVCSIRTIALAVSSQSPKRCRCLQSTKYTAHIITHNHQWHC